MRSSLIALSTAVGFLLACSGSATVEPTPVPTAPLVGSGTAASPHVGDCWTTAAQLGKSAGATDYVACPAGCTDGMIWGTGRYTNDSKVCVAAVHAGALPNAGAGTVIVSLQGKFENFTGSTANGVTSQAWTSSQDLTFTVAASEAAPAPAPVPEPGAAPAPAPAPAPERGGKAGKQKAGKNR